MDVDRNVSATKELEPSPVVQVEMRKHNRFDVVEAVPGCADHGVESIFVSIVGDREELEDDRRPQLLGVGCSPGVVQDRTDLRMIDESTDNGYLSTRRGGRRVLQCSYPCSGQRGPRLVSDVSNCQRAQRQGPRPRPRSVVASECL